MTREEVKANHKRIRELRKVFIMRRYPRAFKQLVIAILDHVNSETLICWPSQPTLAAETCLSERTVRRNLEAIEALKLFTVVTRGAGNQSTHYRLNFDSPAWQEGRLEPVTKLVQKFTTKGMGVTPASSPAPPTEATSVHPEGGRESTPRVDAVQTVPSTKLPPRKCEAVSTPASTHFELEGINYCSEPAALAGDLAAAPPASPLRPSEPIKMELPEPEVSEALKQTMKEWNG